MDFQRHQNQEHSWLIAFPCVRDSNSGRLYLCMDRLTKCTVRYVPEWFPGAGFKKVARTMREDLERLYDVPFDFVKSEMVCRINNARLLSVHRL